MRIAAIRGAGLASLAEPFELDLDGQPLRGAGVFAIVGPTGAGKSTLLDAMCLALFGATPRLRTAGTTRIGESEDTARTAQDPRGLVRADTDAAFAEVDFVGVDGRRYRARWEARRGRREARIATSLLDLATSQRLGGGRKEVLELVVARLGLDEAQFRRSVLLAQGELTAFLHAEERDRAQLLERVTGTEIYGRISIETHLRAAEETARLAALEEALIGFTPLDAHERLRLEHRETDARAEVLAAELGLREAEAEVHWHDVSAVLDGEAREAAQALDAARRQLELAERERSRVVAYRAMAPVRALLARLDRAVAAEREARRRATETLGNARALERDAAELGARAEDDRTFLEKSAVTLDDAASAALVEAVRTHRVAATERARIARERVRDVERDATRATTEIGEAERELRAADTAIAEGERARKGRGEAPALVALALRRGLTPGEPCLVCGATEHPGGPDLAHATASGDFGRAESSAAFTSAEKAATAAVSALARAEAARANRPTLASRVVAAKERQTAAAASLRTATEELSHAEAEAARASAALRDAQAARTSADTAREERRVIERRVREAEALLAGARILAASGKARADAASEELTRAELEVHTARADVQAALAGTPEADARALLAHEPSIVDALEAELRALDERRRSLDAVHEERLRRQKLHQAEAHGSTGREEAQELALQRRRTLDQKRAERAAAEELRVRDDAHRDERTRRDEALREQAERTRVWRTLAATIGSADGKKLRVHAQRLTLELLVEAASEELASLSPRFALELAPGGSLALQVIDRELGGEPRGALSLSGGETFVVSLALALALASLASRRVALGTLFIDEGFGSLDPRSLDVVLSCLEALESRGRQIGLVSHVPDVRERFGARVEVRPVGAGKSRVVTVG